VGTESKSRKREQRKKKGKGKKTSVTKYKKETSPKDFGGLKKEKNGARRGHEALEEKVFPGSHRKAGD